MFRWDHDWFSFNIENLEYLFSNRQHSDRIDILEIGAFEGASTCWFLKCISESYVTTIDTWEGGIDHDKNNAEINFTKVKDNFDYNISLYKDRVTAIKSDSHSALMKMCIENVKKFDFAYIDGSHTASDVNLDLILSFRLLNVGGLLYLDDYFWGFNDKTIYESPKLGIDSFVSVYKDKLRVIDALKNNKSTCFVKVSE